MKFWRWIKLNKKKCYGALCSSIATTTFGLGVGFSDPIKQFFNDCVGGDVATTWAFWSTFGALLLTCPIVFLILRFKRKKKVDKTNIANSQKQVEVAQLQEKVLKEQLKEIEAKKDAIIIVEEKK